jgi:hypothetical protein
MPIPERIPIGDPFTGAVITARGVSLLAQQPPESAEILYSGAMIVRYGVRYLGKPHLSVVPGLVAIDYGDIVNGDAAWEFLLHRSNLYPRAEDLALSPETLVYADAQATTPLARPVALIAASTEGLPPRLLEYLPRYASLQEWEAHERP